MSGHAVPDTPLGPLNFRPLLRRAIWGGTNLATELDKPSGHLDDCSESWEIVDLEDQQSVVDGGPFDGWTLKRLVAERGNELLGRHAPLESFPLLIKFLDATDRLSLQVHPDDVTAARHHPGHRGKTEAWYILSSRPGSRLWVGLHPGTTPEQLATALETGDIDSCVTSFEVRAGQCVIVPAGTIHAIGEGIVLAEIQQSSDLTYRLHDWGRVGVDGQPRQLDLQRGLEAVHHSTPPIAPSTPSDAEGPCESQCLVDLPEFQVDLRRIRGRDEWTLDNRCRILTVVQGEGTLEVDGTNCELSIGRTVLLPADAGQAILTSQHGLALLDSHLP